MRTVPRSNGKNIVHHCSGGGGSVVTNHRCGGGISVTVTRLSLKDIYTYQHANSHFSDYKKTIINRLTQHKQHSHWDPNSVRLPSTTKVHLTTYISARSLTK